MTEREIFIAALQKGDVARRREYLRAACGPNAALLGRVEGLLQAYEGAVDFLESPALARAADLNGHGSVEGPGTIIGPYKLLEEIGEGGMGVVFMAEQASPVRRKVALKIIKPGMDTRQVIARFEAERQALALMDHPNIAKVLDAGTTESGRPYFVMELVRGIPITGYCGREQLTIRERLELFVLVCRAVQHAHQKGIIHRDIKPSNILVAMIDGAAVPKVIDFGIAKATGTALTERILFTVLYQFIGTPMYMSPEQADLSGNDVDTRSDIYALGVLLYELLTGTTPFDSETLNRPAFDEMRRIIREEEPPRPSTRLSTIDGGHSGVRELAPALGSGGKPPHSEATTSSSVTAAHRRSDPRRLAQALRGELDWIVMKALEKDRRRRYETANDFAGDVMRYLADQPVEACPPSAWYRFSKSARRNRVALVTAGLVMLALIGGTIVSTWQAMVAARARRETSRALATARAEADKAAAINDFLTRDLLGQADPSNNPAAQRITLREVLDRAADQVGERFRDRPLVEAALRCTLGETYWGLGAYDRSRQQYSAARVLYERELGPHAPETAIAMAGLGEALRRLNELPQAEPLLRQALGILLRVRGEEHPDTLDAMNKLSGLFFLYPLPDRPREFDTLMEKRLEICRRVFGPEDRRTVASMGNLAELLISRGRPSEAEPLAAQALEISRRGHGEDDVGTLWHMAVLGRSCDAQGRYPEAERWFTRAVEGGRRVMGEEHTYVQSFISYLAYVYQSQGKLVQAEPLWRELLAIQRRTLPADRRDAAVSGTLAVLGLCLLRQERAAEAESCLRECLAIREATMPEDWLRYNAMSLLGGSLLGQNQHDEAEPLLLAGYEGMTQRERKIPPEGKIRLTEAIERLAQLYGATGDKVQAEAWRRLAVARDHKMGFAIATPREGGPL